VCEVGEADKRRGQLDGGSEHDLDRHVFTCNVSGLALAAGPECESSVPASMPSSPNPCPCRAILAEGGRSSA
jgi:hypothetical protein